MGLIISILITWLASIGLLIQSPVTGEQEFIWISESWEVALGERFALSRFESFGPLCEDDALSSYVGMVGYTVAMKSDRPLLPYEFYVLESPVINAWSTLGGKIAITTAMLYELDNEAELAAVLAHEIGHVALRHSVKHPFRKFFLGCLSILTRKDTEYIDLAYSRRDEYEADRLAVLYLSRAGYDTFASVTLMEKLSSLSENSQSYNFFQFLSTHPLCEERLVKIKNLLKNTPNFQYLGEDAYQSMIHK